MPCKDITDFLRIRINPDGRLLNYALRKKTCKGEVGQKSLLESWLLDRPVEEIVELSPEELFREFPTNDEVDEYLLIKHFIAVKAGLGILLGRESGGVNDFCTVDSILSSPNGTELLAELKVAAMTAEISACASCCTSKRH